MELREALTLYYRAQPGPTWTEFLAWPPEMREMAAEIGDAMEQERINAEAVANATALRSDDVMLHLLGDKHLEADVAERRIVSARLGAS